jgi:hypothetical protein
MKKVSIPFTTAKTKLIVNTTEDPDAAAIVGSSPVVVDK